MRGYTSEPVVRDAILRLVDAAVHAPSAINRQPWIFTVSRRALAAGEVDYAFGGFDEA